MNIINAIKDKNLFRLFIGEVLKTWFNWFQLLKCLYGLPIKKQQNLELVKKCTGREPASMPKEGFDVALFLVGRRSGKSKIAAVIGAYEAALSGREKLLAKGETGIVAIISPTRKQSRIVKNYLRAIFAETPLLQNEIETETQEGFLLSNGVLIEILVGDYRAIRGYTLLAAIVDEIAFFGLDSESKVKNDTELIRAIQPSLATVQGKLIAIGSPYAKKGWSYSQYKKNWGNNQGKTLVWNCSSRTMNPTLDQKIVDDALLEDLAAAKSEYLGEFRDDVCIFLPPEIIESCVIRNRFELLHNPNLEYFAFADLSGGRGDEAALCISHKNGRKVVIDFLKRYSAPCNPYSVIENMCGEARRYRIRKVVGDNYSANFVSQAFINNGMRYEKSELPKSQLFLNFLPIICSGLVELLDDNVSVAQFSALERRTHSGGKDIVCKPQGGKDDAANTIAGAAHISSVRRLVIGAFGRINRTRCYV